MINRIVRDLIDRLDLNLSGKVVVTELASEYYLYAPIIAALAGAKVYALGKDTRYGQYEELKEELVQESILFEVNERIEIHRLEEFSMWDEADIITNSGMIRPINSTIISKLKNTSVIPLMWETWEFRSDEIDLKACQQKGIPVIGTNENYSIIDMYKYPGMLAIHILHKLNSDYSSDRILLLGGGLTGTLIYKTLSFFNSSILWYANEKHKNLVNQEPRSYNELKELENLNQVDVVLIAEHVENKCLLGLNGIFSFQELAKRFKDLRIGHLCGNIDFEDLRNSGLRYYPSEIASFGYMSVLPNMFGPKPILKLIAGGLKVGEIASNARGAGLSINDTIKVAVDSGVGMDFYGGFLNYQTNH